MGAAPWPLPGAGGVGGRQEACGRRRGASGSGRRPGQNAPASFDRRLAIDRPPLQSAVPAHVTAVPAGEFRLKPMADFEFEARVLGRKDYRRGVEAGLSLLDLALGWGPMVRPEVLESIRIRQPGRFYLLVHGSFSDPAPGH